MQKNISDIESKNNFLNKDILGIPSDGYIEVEKLNQGCLLRDSYQRKSFDERNSIMSTADPKESLPRSQITPDSNIHYSQNLNKKVKHQNLVLIDSQFESVYH